jgi:hypothetical protein
MQQNANAPFNHDRPHLQTPFDVQAAVSSNAVGGLCRENALVVAPPL